MAARMGKARLRDNQANEVKASTYQKKDGPVVCFHCRCPLRFVPKTTSNRGSRQITTAAYFGLPARAKQKGAGHAKECPFDIQPVVSSVVGRSQEIRMLDPDSEQLVEALSSGVIQFRLHILMEAISRSASAGDKLRKTVGTEDKPPSTATRYIRSERTLLPYLNMAQSILTLIARVQDNPALAHSVRLRYAHHKVPWREYFFSTTAYCRLAAQLSQLREMGKFYNDGRPVALAVQLLANKEPKPTKYQTWQLTGRSQRCPTTAGIDVEVWPKLYFRDKELADAVAAGKRVLVHGLPKLGKEWIRSDGTHQIDVSINVDHSSQWCLYPRYSGE